MAISQPPFQSTLVDADDRVQTPWAQWFSQLQPVLQAVVASGPTSGRPTQNLFIGYPYFDTTIDQMVYWNGVIWVTYAPSTTGTSILKGNGTGGFNSAIAGIDFAPATSGTAILYGNGGGGFSSVAIGSGVTFAGGVLSATGLGGTVTSVSGTGSVNGITLTGTVISAGSLTLGGTLGGIGNSQLTNSSITINGSTVSLGGSTTVTATATNALTIGTGLSGTSYNGSTAVTIANTGVLSITGTALQITASASTGAVTLSLPQDIAATSSPTFVGTNFSGTATSLSIGGNAATASKWATARNLAGNSVDGSVNVAFANKFIVQGTTDTGLTNAQFLGALGTGIVKNTTSTGILSIAASGTDYAPATSGSAILYGNGSGGFSSVTIGTGVSFITGTLSATGSGGTVTSVSGTGTVNGLTLTGTVTTSGNLTLGGTLSLISPPAIGSTTPNSGAFTTLTSSSDAVLHTVTVGEGGGSGSNNVILGGGAGGAFTSGGNNTLIGKSAGSNITSGGSNIIVGTSTTAGAATDGNCIVIGVGTAGQGSNTTRIATFSGGYGSVYQGNNSTLWAITSDKRLKKNIVDNTIGLDAINAIQVKNFEYRLAEEVTELPQNSAINIQGVQLGVIAQELQAIFPECIKIESTGVMSVDASNLTWYMINAIKEQQTLIEALTARLTTAGL